MNKMTPRAITPNTDDLWQITPGELPIAHLLFTTHECLRRKVSNIRDYFATFSARVFARRDDVLA